jgi:hypothetical protein
MLPRHGCPTSDLQPNCPDLVKRLLFHIEIPSTCSVSVDDVLRHSARIVGAAGVYAEDFRMTWRIGLIHFTEVNDRGCLRHDRSPRQSHER